MNLVDYLRQFKEGDRVKFAKEMTVEDFLDIGIDVDTLLLKAGCGSLEELKDMVFTIRRFRSRKFGGFAVYLEESGYIFDQDTFRRVLRKE